MRKAAAPSRVMYSNAQARREGTKEGAYSALVQMSAGVRSLRLSVIYAAKVVWGFNKRQEASERPVGGVVSKSNSFCQGELAWSPRRVDIAV